MTDNEKKIIEFLDGRIKRIDKLITQDSYKFKEDYTGKLNAQWQELYHVRAEIENIIGEDNG